ncbi:MULTISPECIES: uracil-DNA glycosylase [Sulfurospirillum]|jgi:DNA polymerase|uniref:Type-4 uracil-DNA glycosylase n=1 Tax=Sulfurospirillum cavolei TaxID=366522 RepID=A0A2D3W5A4_9BACT|nr:MULTISPECIES: uracil-DNA glycosylase [Sulfurospirillum]KHG33515.1 MAG: DNA polymerase [Sulfurospirillum sp. MES]MCD8545434.1 uracil-DNA glycosylase [Sulfurospirillum cavolei]MCP3651458.1 uracil-DNA glycosylase [Sulfurospirillum sp. DNRA8]MCR1810305.1 uracil-DNA glycosylase [Sulfurospirillum sp. DNRA8]DAB36542.1 MAG TPA: uracil-DNA glycosylase [Sulfurospirillum cavolei]
MTPIEKIRLLKLLYQYRAMGFEYFQEYRPLASVPSLPQTLEELKRDVAHCHLCALSKSRKNVVFGAGNLRAKVMFIGDNPGANEDETGLLYAGKSGELLAKMIENVLLVPKEEVYVTTILKCKTPQNRVPTPEEVACCKPYVMQQIQTIKPQIIVALGSTAFHHLTGEYDTPIDRVRGSVLNFGEAKLVATFHPSFLLRNPSAKKEVFADLLKIRSML